MPPRLPVEDTYLELLADTLESLDLPARGQFLQRFLRAISHVELRESECVQIWDEMLNRRRALTDQAGRPVVLKAALMDVLATSGFLRVPIILEYEELKKLEGQFKSMRKRAEKDGSPSRHARPPESR